jgi:hypothetical protein
MKARRATTKRVYLLAERELPVKERTAFLRKNLSLELRELLQNKAIEVAEDKLSVGSFNRWVLENCYAGWENLCDEDDGQPIEYKSPQDFGVLEEDAVAELIRIVLGRKRTSTILKAELEATLKLEKELSDAEEAEKN